MNTEDLSNQINEKGMRGALKHCIASGEHRQGTAYLLGRFVGIALILGFLAGIGLLLAVGTLGTLGGL